MIRDGFGNAREVSFLEAQPRYIRRECFRDSRDHSLHPSVQLRRVQRF